MTGRLSLNQVLARLDNVQRNGWRASARCPAHPDAHNSLAVSAGDDGGVLLYCHAGCAFEEIMAAILAAGEKTCNKEGHGQVEEEREESDGLTLETYALEKHLSIASLRKFGLRTISLSGRRVLRIPYYDENSKEVAVRLRFAMKGKERFKWRKGSRQQLYGLWRIKKIRDAGVVILVEGESDCHTLWSKKLPALGLPGANSWHGEWAEVFDGIPLIYVVIEPDRGGQAALEWLAKSRIRDRVRLVHLTGAKDASELYIADPDNFEAAFKAALQASTKWKGETHSEKPIASKGRASQATRLIALTDDVKLFHSAEGRSYATIPAGNHVENWAVKAHPFQHWLANRFFEREKRAPSSTALRDALGVIEGKARYNGPEESLFVRVAESSGNIYLDLCDSRWRAVEITAEGWRIIDKPPVRFRRTPGMLTLPDPEEDGKIEALWRVLNLASERHRTLAVAWLVTCLRGSGPYPILTVNGGQGSAKSTAQRILRRLIDPNKCDLRTPPRDERDLMIAANNSLIISYDNVSYLPPWLSDGMCRLATGGGFATRELYSDDAESLFDAMRPIVLNGIEEVATRGDFLERSINLELLDIKKKDRLPEKKLWREFGKIRPSILGALLNILSSALREFPSVKLTEYPRMADFAQWASAAEGGMGLKRGAFMIAYTENQAAMNSLALEASPVSSWIEAIAEESSPWEGTASELLQELERRKGFHNRSESGWPKNPRALSNALRRLSKNLRAVGVVVTFGREARRRLIRLETENE